MNFTPAMAQRIELWPLDRLKPYVKNARTHSEGQVAQIASSIVEYGFISPLLVSGGGDIMAGHGRLTSRAERVVLMKGAQLGGTEAGLNWLGYVMRSISSN